MGHLVYLLPRAQLIKVYLTGRRADTLAQAVAKLDKIKPGRAIAYLIFLELILTP